MRIAIVTTSWPASEGDPTGHFVRAEARESEREGHGVTVVAPPPSAPDGPFGWPGAVTRIREQPLRALAAASWIARARARVAGLDVDRVVGHWAVPCAWPIGAASRAPVDAVSHGGDVRLLAAMPLVARDRVACAIASRATVWRFVSEALMQKLLAALGAEARGRVERVARVQAPPLEMPDVRGATLRRRRELGVARVAVSVGRLIVSKRMDRAIEYVARSGEWDVLVVVGDGPERDRLERLARKAGVNARFVGAVNRDDALAWIGAADALIQASEAEGLSTVVREAEALGTRVRRL